MTQSPHSHASHPHAAGHGTAHAPAPQHRPIHSGMVLTGLSLAILLSQLGTNIINVALPTLVKDLGVPFGSVQWVVVSYLLVVTALIVGVGRFGDQLGKKRLYLWGLAIFMAASVLCALSTNLPLLIAGRAGQGLGGAILMALSFAFVGASASPWACSPPWSPSASRSGRRLVRWRLPPSAGRRCSG